MLFNSIDFLIFFPVVASVFFLLPHRYRWMLLLAASYFFYMSWKPEYIILILISTLIDYVAGLTLANESRLAIRRAILGVSLAANLGLLFLFKYFNFFNETFGLILRGTGVAYPTPALNFLLPVGISFYTFQTMSYTIDVYRGKIQPEKHFGIFALFVSFFPQLVAGPIERTSNLLPQFRRATTFDYERVVSGLQLMTWGFFKKLVIADRLALLVNPVYANPTQYTGVPLLVATYAFAFQIYCDFSAYTDIAIGAARVMGFDLIQNFRQPYYATSIPEFWRRWHISLSTWFRDYLYVPLGGSRVSVPRWVFNIMIVFLVSGLWHGAKWTFVVWGALHGGFMLASIVWRRATERTRWPLTMPPAINCAAKIFVTFNLVTFAWIFFRAESLSDAGYIVGHLFTNLEFSASLSRIMPHARFELGVALIAILGMEIVHWVQMTNHSLRWVARGQAIWVRWPAYYALLLVVIMFGKFNLTEFIYFQF